MKTKLFLLLLFVTGCTPHYNVIIKNNDVIENMTSSVLISDEKYSELLELQKENQYTLSLTKISDNQQFFKYKRELSLDNFNQNTIIGYCFHNYYLDKNKNNIIFITNDYNNCFDDFKEMEEMTFSVKTNHIVEKTNADKKIGSTYYWYYNRENYKSKKIYIELKENKYIINYDGILFKKILFIIVILIVIISLSFTIYRIYKKEDNL